jgi:hypothetical protein
MEILEQGILFDSSFKRYDDRRLSLLGIILSQAPNSDIAFPAAYHTAELTDGSTVDEGGPRSHIVFLPMPNNR